MAIGARPRSGPTRPIETNFANVGYISPRALLRRSPLALLGKSQPVTGRGHMDRVSMSTIRAMAVHTETC